MNKFILTFIVGFFLTINIIAQEPTGEWITNPPSINITAEGIVTILYVGALDEAGEALDTLYGSPIDYFNRYPNHKWIIRTKFTVPAGNCTTTVFMKRGESSHKWLTTTMATDTIREKGVTKDSFEYYVYPLFKYDAYRDFYMPVIVNETGGADSTWFELKLIGYPINN